MVQGGKGEKGAGEKVCREAGEQGCRVDTSHDVIPSEIRRIERGISTQH